MPKSADREEVAQNCVEHVTGHYRRFRARTHQDYGGLFCARYKSEHRRNQSYRGCYLPSVDPKNQIGFQRGGQIGALWVGGSPSCAAHARKYVAMRQSGHEPWWECWPMLIQAFTATASKAPAKLASPAGFALQHPRDSRLHPADVGPLVAARVNSKRAPMISCRWLTRWRALSAT